MQQKGEATMTAIVGVGFVFGFGFEGPVELGRWGEVVALGGGGGRIGLVFGELAGGLAVVVFVFAA